MIVRSLNRLYRRFVYALTAVLLTFSFNPAHAAPDTLGTDFWLAFEQNLGSWELYLFITSRVDTTGTVEIPGLAFSENFSVTANTVTTVTLPTGAAHTGNDSIMDIGIHVTSLEEVTVYGLNRRSATTDAYVGLPTDILGTEYINLGYQNVNIVNASQFAVVGTVDNTTVTITPSVTTGARAAGVPYDVVLNQGEVYQLVNTDPSPADLSGTEILSDQPVGVFGGHQCANIPPGAVACDHLTEMLPPTSAWGTSFVTMPLSTRQNGDTFRVLASEDGTDVSINDTPVATLNRGEVHEQLIDGPATISATGPVLVAQYSNGTSYDGVTSDPFMMLIYPFEQYLTNYTVTTPATGFAINFINVVTPDSAIGSVTFDGVPIPAGDFTPIGTSGFSGAQLSVELGAHTLDSPDPFGAFVYGFAQADSYGYPGGGSLAPVAIATNLTLTPSVATAQVNTEQCLTANVTDQDSNPLEGIRVDFVVSGGHSETGSAFTDVSGDAEFCYTGTIADVVDSVMASVGGLSATSRVNWVTQRQAPDARPVPTLSHAGLILLSGLIALLGFARRFRK